MWITRDIVARTLIWLAAIAVPVQGLPAASCGCASDKTSCKAGDACCCSAEIVRRGRCCCTTRQVGTAHSCCSKAAGGQESACKCGLNCQCGKPKQPKPATPPVENNRTEKVASNSFTTVSVAIVYRPETTRRRDGRCAHVDVVTALDRCTSLCRFTL